MKKILIALLLLVNGLTAQQSIQQDILEIEDKLIEWRRDFHQNPELSNREFKTAEKIAKHLTDIGLQVETNIAKTGVVAILEGDQPGKVIAIRADIDGLPVTERNDLDFKSEVNCHLQIEFENIIIPCLQVLQSRFISQTDATHGNSRHFYQILLQEAFCVL